MCLWPHVMRAGRGFNEQIFGADEQVSAGLVQKMTLHE
jgi:hypothetical protein